ncbi:MAG: phosphatase PAP2 family protein, partial [Myxococcales bacterium]
AALALASGAAFVVGRERVCAGEHWASDVVAGTVLGVAIGTVLGRLARDSARRGAADGLLEDPAR